MVNLSLVEPEACFLRIPARRTGEVVICPKIVNYALTGRRRRGADMMQAAAEALLAPLNALDRADMSRSSKESLRNSIVAIATAYAEDDDPQKVAPNAQSFARLVRFLEHPHRWPWITPALSVSPEGTFSAVWDAPGVHRWILDFLPDGRIDVHYLETFPDGRVEYSQSSYETASANKINPPFRID